MTIWKKLRRSTASRTAAASYLAFASTAAFGLLTIPIAVAFLEREELGLWTVVHAFLGYLIWMDLGIGGATGRLMADAVSKRDQVEINRWWTLTRAALIIQGLLVIGVGLALQPLLLVLLDVPDDLLDEARWLLAGGVILTGLTIPMRGMPGLLTAQDRFYWVPLFQAIAPWINLTVFYFLLRAGFGLKAYLCALAASQAATWAGYLFIVWTGPDRPRFDRRGLGWARFKRLFGFSGNITVMGLVETLMQTLPAILIARLGGLGMVPIYNFSWKGPYLASSLVKRTYQAFYPRLQRLYVSGKRPAFRLKHEEVGRLAIGVSLVVGGMVLFGNTMIVQLLAGPGFYIGPLANMWFAVAMVTFTLTGMFRILLPISGNLGKNALVSVIKLGISAALTVLLWERFGLAGVAAVFALTPLITGAYCYFRGIRNCGYGLADLSPSVVAWGFAGILVVAATGLLVAATTDTGPTFDLGGRTITAPTIPTLLLALLPLVPGAWLIASFARRFLADHRREQRV